MLSFIVITFYIYFTHSSDQFIVFSGAAPHDLVDGDSVSVWDGKETTTLQLTSPVRGMHIIEDVQSDMDSGIVGAASEMDNQSTGMFDFVDICLFDGFLNGRV